MNDAALRERLASAVVDAFGSGTTVTRVEQLHGDASTRTYLRLAVEGAAPATVIAMVLGDGGPGASDELGGDDGGGTNPFVTVGAYLEGHGVAVPTVYLDAAHDGLLLVEDIGDTTLWQAASDDPPSAPRRFAAAIDLLVELQTIGARDPDPACPAFSRRFDDALARAELEHFIDHGVETRHGVTLSAPDRAALLGCLEPLTEPFRAGPTTFSHRDYMAWNVHVQGARLRLIDFQDALIAPDAFDLAQLLTDRTTTTLLDQQTRDGLIARFESGRASAGLPVPPGLGDRVARCALQHALKVIGRFHYLEMVKERPGYLAYLPAVYSVVSESLTRVEGGAALRAALAPWIPELHD